MAELADAADLKSAGAILVGSSPSPSTKQGKYTQIDGYLSGLFFPLHQSLDDKLHVFLTLGARQPLRMEPLPIFWVGCGGSHEVETLYVAKRLSEITIELLSSFPGSGIGFVSVSNLIS